MKKHLRVLSAVAALAVTVTVLMGAAGCVPDKKKGYVKNTDLDTTENISLRLAMNTTTWTEMDNVIAKFEEIYPNCSITCEYIENFATNLNIRLGQNEQKIDIFRTSNIQKTTPYKDYSLNLISEESKKILDLSGANKGLVDNFRYTDAENTQYAVPYGGEMRGMYVNVTLLKKFNLEVPTNREELLHCCEVLYNNGYIPFQSSNGTFAQQLLYPMVCSKIVNGGNYEADYAAIENIDAGISEYFRDTYEFLYTIVQKGYFDYKRVEDELHYTFSGSDGKAKEFLDIAKVDEDNYAKQDDTGHIAFITDTQAFESYLNQNKSDYNSNIEYKFILSPVGTDGGYAYLSPADGLAINKNSDHTDWALEFLNFFFTPEIATAFAEETGKIPNTADALLKYDVPAGHSCDVGQVTFSYGFYKVITTLMMGGYSDSYIAVSDNYIAACPDATYYYNAGTADEPDYKEAAAEYRAENSDVKFFRHSEAMIGISKMNAQKYMKDNGDGTYSLVFSLEDYMSRLEQEFLNIKYERQPATK